MQFLSEILKWEPIPQDTIVYFRERLRHRLHSAILDAFTRREKERGLKQKELAARIHKSSVQINRWLSTASNLTLDSISDLMVGLGMDFDTFPFTPVEKTITATEQQVSSERVHLGKMLEKAQTRFEGISARRYWEKMALSSRPSERSSGPSATALAPPPCSGTMTSTVIEALQKHPSAKVIDFAAHEQKRTEQSARRNAFPKSGVAA
jgi:transcriptional regulator with XRE-family HTH domain